MPTKQMFFISRLIFTVFFLTVAGSAFAAVIFDSGGPNNSQWRNSDFSNQFGGQAADDFILESDSIVTDVHWFGSYLFTPTQPMPDDFTINFYSDDLNNPADNPFHTATFSSEIIRTFTGVVASTTSGDFQMFEYAVDIEALALSANTRYWLSIVNRTSDTTQFGGWAWAYNQDGEDPAQAGTDTTHRWLREGGEWTTFGSSNLAFTLTNDALDVPEPSIIALMAVGLAGLGIAQSRKTRH